MKSNWYVFNCLFGVDIFKIFDVDFCVDVFDDDNAADIEWFVFNDVDVVVVGFKETVFNFFGLLLWFKEYGCL